MYQTLEYKAGGPFELFLEEVSRARREADKSKKTKMKTFLRETFELLGKSLCRILVQKFIRYINTSFIRDDNDTN